MEATIGATSSVSARVSSAAIRGAGITHQPKCTAEYGPRPILQALCGGSAEKTRNCWPDPLNGGGHPILLVAACSPPPQPTRDSTKIHDPAAIFPSRHRGGRNAARPTKITADVSGASPERPHALMRLHPVHHRPVTMPASTGKKKSAATLSHKGARPAPTYEGRAHHVAGSHGPP
jgi:hypothetical protein